MTKQSNHVFLKTTIAIAAVLGIPAIGVGGYYELKERAAANVERIQIIEARQIVERQEWNSDVAALRSLVDVLLAKVNNSESKIDMLVQMLRDHATFNSGGSK